MNYDIDAVKRELLRCLAPQSVAENRTLADYTTMKVGGPAALFVSPAGTSELFDALAVAWHSDLPHIVIGNGSNIIFHDEGYDGIVIRLGAGIDHVLIEGTTVFSEAGALLADVAKKACDAGLAGMEFASGIPGSVGGAVFMNAGAYGGDMAGIVHTVSSLSSGGIAHDRRAPELALGYRTSVFQQNGETIYGVKFVLKEGCRDEIQKTVGDYAARRASKQPQGVPSSGSFFKRPEGHFAGQLIEEARLKGLSCGGARVSDLHAGFIINADAATAQDIVDLMHIVQETVFERSGVLLEPEVRLLNRDGTPRL